MKKKIIASLFAIASVVLISGQLSFAQDMAGRWGVGARAGYFNYAGDDWDIFGYNIESDFDDALMYGGNITCFVHKYFSFELSVDHVEADVDLKANILGTDIREVVGVGEIEQLPILFTARTHFSTNPTVNAYFGVGIGYYVNDFHAAYSVRSLLPPGGTIECDDSFGFHLSTGVEFFLNEHFALNLDLKYIWNEADLKAKAPGYVTEEVDFGLDGFFAGAGFKVYL